MSIGDCSADTVAYPWESITDVDRKCCSISNPHLHQFSTDRLFGCWKTLLLLKPVLEAALGMVVKAVVEPGRSLGHTAGHGGHRGRQVTASS